ncbi:MAG: hypothetical protein ACPHN3_04695, partial [Spongiibacter sp.]
AFANSPRDTENIIDLTTGAPLVVKLLESSQGKGVVLAETKKAASRAAKLTGKGQQFALANGKMFR